MILYQVFRSSIKSVKLTDVLSERKRFVVFKGGEGMMNYPGVIWNFRDWDAAWRRILQLWCHSSKDL